MKEGEDVESWVNEVQAPYRELELLSFDLECVMCQCNAQWLARTILGAWVEYYKQWVPHISGLEPFKWGKEIIQSATLASWGPWGVVFAGQSQTIPSCALSTCARTGCPSTNGSTR